MVSVDWEEAEIRVRGLKGLGHVLGARLSGLTHKVSYHLKQDKYLPATTEIRQAADAYLTTDSVTKISLDRMSPTKIGPFSATSTLEDLGYPVSGINPYTLKEQALWSGNLEKYRFNDDRGNFLGISYPLEKEDLPHILSAAYVLGHIRSSPSSVPPREQNFDDPDDDVNARYVEALYDNKNPYDDGFHIIHAEMDMEGRFHARANVPPSDIYSDTSEGEIMAFKPEDFADIVATDPDLKKAVAKNPEYSILMLSSADNPAASKFADSLQKTEGFNRDIYFANDTQIAWLDPPQEYNTLSAWAQRNGMPPESWVLYPRTRD